MLLFLEKLHASTDRFNLEFGEHAQSVVVFMTL